MVVLTESEDSASPGMITGHTSNFIPVALDNSRCGSNQLIEVEIVENTPNGLIGRMLPSVVGELSHA